jgi:7-keto-8-aminopelargonate synthetase-like enzyme
MNARLQKKLWQNINYFYVQAKKYLDLPKPLSAIVPLIIGDEEEALKRSQDLEKKGFVLPAVRYPTVPKGKARLRITITADQAKRDIDRLIAALRT